MRRSGAVVGVMPASNPEAEFTWRRAAKSTVTDPVAACDDSAAGTMQTSTSTRNRTARKESPFLFNGGGASRWGNEGACRRLQFGHAILAQTAELGLLA